MTVEEFIESEITKLLAFQQYWNEMHEASPDNWTKTNDYPDWEEQYEMMKDTL